VVSYCYLGIWGVLRFRSESREHIHSGLEPHQTKFLAQMT
jgi:hypothetical protein